MIQPNLRKGVPIDPSHLDMYELRAWHYGSIGVYGQLVSGTAAGCQPTPVGKGWRSVQSGSLHFTPGPAFCKWTSGCLDAIIALLGKFEDVLHGMLTLTYG